MNNLYFPCDVCIRGCFSLLYSTVFLLIFREVIELKDK